jgi:hypothetical protein
MSLFTSRSLWTMLHGIVLGGTALLTLAAALFYLRFAPSSGGAAPPIRQERALSWLLAISAAALWIAVIGGTYVVFPPYRATPPEGLTDLSAYPRSLLLASASTAWLHSLAMELKEHVPWVAAMLATAVAFVASRRGPALQETRGMASTLIGICLALAAAAALLGTFVNKVAPLQ